MSKLQELVDEHGLTLATAAKAVLEIQGEGGIYDLADRLDLNSTAMSALLNGSAQSPYEKERLALADYFDVEREWLDEKIADAHEARATRKVG